MSLTVAQALELAGLSEGILLAGRRNLSNVIERVSILEAPYKTNWDIENDLFITCFYAVKEDIPEQIKTIELFARSKCAGLVFQLGVLKELPPQVIERAEELGLPLIQVPERITYPEIITPVVGAILEEKNYLLQRSEEIHRRLTDQCLAGGGLQAIAATLNDLVNKPVAIVNAWGNLAACAGTTGPISQNLEWVQTSTGPYPAYVPSEEVWLMALFSGQQRDSDGFIVVYDPQHSLEALDLVAIEQASIVAALEMVKERAILETERRLERDFFETVLSSLDSPADVILSKAASLGWELSDKHVIGMIHLEPGLHGGSSDCGETIQHEVMSRIISTATQVVKEHHAKGIVIDQGENIILIPHCEETAAAQTSRDLQSMAERVISRIQPLAGRCQVAMVYGGIQGSFRELRSSYDEAKLALNVCKRLSLYNQIIWYNDVALYVLLDRIVSQPETTQWFEKTLGKLVAYDRNNGTNLVHTLETYFDNNQMLQQTAYHLFVHSKTLKYRLHRIEEILGTDPFSTGQQLNFYIATKLARFFDISAQR